MKKILRILGINLLVLLGVGLVLFFGAEIYLRAKASSPAKTFTAVGLPIYQKSEATSWEHKPEVSIAEYPEGSGEALQLNCRGERGEECREPGPLESVIMLGDSFTFGINAKQSAIFPVLLDKKLGINTEVRNQGTIGFTLDQYAAYIHNLVNERERSGSQQPNLVVLNLFVGNDITELRRHTVDAQADGIPTKVHDTEVFVGDDGTLQSYTTPPPSSLAWYKLRQAIKAIALKTGAEKITKPTLTWPVFLAADNPAQDPYLPKYWRTAESVLFGLDKFLSEHNVKFLVVFIPMDVQVSKSYWSKYPGTPFDDESFNARRPQQHLSAYLKLINVPYVDLLPQFQSDSQKDELYFAKDDTHFTEYGHRRVAEILEPVIRDMLK